MLLWGLRFVIAWILPFVYVTIDNLIFVFSMPLLRIESHSIAQVIFFIRFRNVVVWYCVLYQVDDSFLHGTAMVQRFGTCCFVNLFFCRSLVKTVAVQDWSSVNVPNVGLPLGIQYILWLLLLLRLHISKVEIILLLRYRLPLHISVLRRSILRLWLISSLTLQNPIDPLYEVGSLRYSWSGTSTLLLVGDRVQFTLFYFLYRRLFVV